MSSGHTQSIRSAKRVRPAVALLLLLLAFSLPPGCGTAKVYEGPKLPKAEIAVLKTPIFFGTFSLVPQGPPQIVNIDGQQVSVFDKTFELHPGRHQVSLLAGAGCGFQEPAYLEFAAKGGHVYQLHTKVGTADERVWSWVVDNNSGEVVGGKKPH